MFGLHFIPNRLNENIFFPLVLRMLCIIINFKRKSVYRLFILPFCLVVAAVECFRVSIIFFLCQFIKLKTDILHKWLWLVNIIYNLFNWIDIFWCFYTRRSLFLLFFKCCVILNSLVWISAEQRNKFFLNVRLETNILLLRRLFSN